MVVVIGVAHHLVARVVQGFDGLRVLLRPISHNKEGGLDTIPRQNVDKRLGVLVAPRGVEADSANLLVALHRVDGQLPSRGRSADRCWVVHRVKNGRSGQLDQAVDADDGQVNGFHQFKEAVDAVAEKGQRRKHQQGIRQRCRNGSNDAGEEAVDAHVLNVVDNARKLPYGQSGHQGEEEYHCLRPQETRHHSRYKEDACDGSCYKVFHFVAHNGYAF